MQMVTSTKATGSVTRPRVREHTLIKTVLTTTVNGWLTNSMDMESNLGRMAHATRAIMKTAKSKDRAD